MCGICRRGEPSEITDGTLDTKGLTDNKACGLNVRFGPSLTSKAVSDVVDPLATAKPDQLYGLEVWQYDGNGTFQSGMGKASAMWLSAPRSRSR